MNALNLNALSPTIAASKLSARWRYALCHLLTSVVVFSLALLVVFFVWYPAPFARLLDVTPILGMMAMVDVIIGPLLSFVVYKTGKKTLKMDLGIIIMVQLIAFLYGMHTVYQSRPAYITLDDNSFLVVSAKDVIITEKTPEAYRNLPQTPQFVALSPPNGMTMHDLYHKLPEQGNLYAQYYAPLAPKFFENRGFNIDVLRQKNDADAVAAALAQYPTATHYIPLMAGENDMTVLIDKDAGVMLDVVPLKPW